MSSDLSEDICVLLRERIDTYEALEVLLLLHRERGTQWTIIQLSCALRIPQPLIAAAVSALEAAGLARRLSAESTASVVYSAPNPAMDDVVARLSQEYRDQPLLIIKLMSANAIERVRTAALHAFADAFLLRKD